MSSPATALVSLDTMSVLVEVGQLVLDPGEANYWPTRKDRGPGVPAAQIRSA